MSTIKDTHGDAMVVYALPAGTVHVDSYLDADGCGGVNQVQKCRHIFTPAQARTLAAMLLAAAAYDGESEK